MAKVSIENGQLVVFFEGIRKIAVVKNKMSIPLENVAGAVVDPDAWNNAPRPFQKRCGTDSYGFYFGGSFVQKGDKMFYDLKKSERAIIINLKEEKFDYLILGVAEPEKTVDLINSAINPQKEVEGEFGK